MFDLAIVGGEVIDGTGRQRFPADVGVIGDRVSAVRQGLGGQARREINAAGSVVCPGFIEAHGHSEGWMLKHGSIPGKLEQGYTTELLMADGISYAPVNQATAHQWLYYLRGLNGLSGEDYDGWQTIAEFAAKLQGKSRQNFAFHLPYGNVRSLVLGFSSAAPTAEQLRAIRSIIEQEDAAAGCAALSTGLEYAAQTSASKEELSAACQALHRGPYVTHIRYPLGLMEGVREAVAIGRAANVPVHISHLKARTARQAEELISFIDTFARNEVQFSFDVYPYSAASTLLAAFLPPEIGEEGPAGAGQALACACGSGCMQFPELEAVLDETYIAWLPSSKNRAWIGRSLADYCGAGEKAPADALCALLLDEDCAVLLVMRRGADEVVHPFLAHPCAMIGTDGVYQPGGMVHPRLMGTPGRILGACVRDFHLFTLEQAVRKMTGAPAALFKLERRGLIAEGCFADLVVFDPQGITDHATYDEPLRASSGISAVVVNGEVCVEGGVLSADARRGAFIRC